MIMNTNSIDCPNINSEDSLFSSMLKKFPTLIGIIFIIIFVSILFLLDPKTPILEIYVVTTVILGIISIISYLVNLNNLSEEIKYSEPEIYQTKDLEERIELILNQANIVFNRLEESINTLKNQVSMFFAIMIATATFTIPILQIFHTANNEQTTLQFILFIIPFVFLILISVILIISIFWGITEYFDIDIFRIERFKEIINADKIDILIDFLFFIRCCYENNYEIYGREMFKFQNSLNFFVSAIVYLLAGMSILFMCKTTLG